MKKFILSVITLITIGSTYALAQDQDTSISLTGTMEFKDENAVKKYDLQYFSYSINKNDAMGILAEEGASDISTSFYLTVTLKQVADKSILKWMSNPSETKEVKITVTNKATKGVTKEFILKKAYISSQNESYYSYAIDQDSEDATETTDPSASTISINCEQLIIGGITINTK